jgi:hypothetical protein
MRTADERELLLSIGDKYCHSPDDPPLRFSR